MRYTVICICIIIYNYYINIYIWLHYIRNCLATRKEYEVLFPKCFAKKWGQTCWAPWRRLVPLSAAPCLLALCGCLRPDENPTKIFQDLFYSFPSFPPLQLSTVLEHLSLKCPVPTVPKSRWDGADPGESLARSRRNQSFLADVTSHQSPLSGLTWIRISLDLINAIKRC